MSLRNKLIIGATILGLVVGGCEKEVQKNPNPQKVRERLEAHIKEKVEGNDNEFCATDFRYQVIDTDPVLGDSTFKVSYANNDFIWTYGAGVFVVPGDSSDQIIFRY